MCSNEIIFITIFPAYRIDEKEGCGMDAHTGRVWQDWTIVRQIGQGSYGTVYEIQRDIHGDVEKAALKVLSVPHNEDELDYLRGAGVDDASITQTFHQQVGDIAKEYKLTKQLSDNLNIVRCEDYREIQHDDGLGWDIYIRMELLTPYKEWREKVTTEDQIIQLGKDICGALVACQEKNIIHRDIKPQNVFMSEKGQFKLGDFGIAKTMGQMSQATVGIGTYSYMAPEVKNGQPYDRTADICSLGLMMYGLLNNGRTPFLPPAPNPITPGEREKAINRRMAGEKMPDPACGCKELKRIVLKACAFNPKDRYQSAREMLEDLNHLTSAVVAPDDLEKTCGAQSFEVFAKKQEDKKADPEPDDLEKTYGAQSFEKFAKKQSGKNVETDPDDLDATVGRQFGSQLVQPKKKSSNFLKYALIALGGVVVAVLILLPKSCAGENSGSRPSAGVITPMTEPSTTVPETETTGATETTETTNITPEPTEATSATLEPAEWSDWLDALPTGITGDKYEIEERILYQKQETKQSTEKKNMEGWELYKTVDGNGDYGPWSQWSTEKVKESQTRKVEGPVTKYRYRDKETTTSTASKKDGWTRDDKKTTYSMGDWGSWSNWSETSVTKTETREVNTKTQYRYSDITYSSDYTEWSAWGSWKDTPIEKTDLVDVTTRMVYPYYYFKCPVCGAHMFSSGSGACNPGYGGCGADIPSGARKAVWNATSWDKANWKAFGSSGKSYTEFGGEKVFKWENTEAKKQYRSRTRKVESVPKEGAWSSWSFTEYTESKDRKVQTRTVYQYRERTRIATYHFYRWGSWSEWTNKKMSQTDTREVQSDNFYRYCDKTQATTYYYRRWTDWTVYSEGAEVPQGAPQKTQYRYKPKKN